MNVKYYVSYRVLLCAAMVVTAPAVSPADHVITQEVMGNGASVQSDNTYSLSGTLGQPFIGTVVSSSRTLESGFWYTTPSIEPQPIVLEPPSNLSVRDVPEDNGYNLTLTWDISSSEEQGQVAWYRIYRSRTETLSDPIALSELSSIDSLIVYEQYHTILIDSVAVGTSEFTDYVPLTGVLYYYWVQAVGANGESHKIAADITTSVEDVPRHFFVSDPFPNPCNPVTSISYEVPVDTHVTFLVYNISGQRVATLRNRMTFAGNYRLSWNAQGIPSGIYLLRFQAGRFTDTKKLVLLK